jgi:hypothetical protein
MYDREHIMGWKTISFLVEDNAKVVNLNSIYECCCGWGQFGENCDGFCDRKHLFLLVSLWPTNLSIKEIIFWNIQGSTRPCFPANPSFHLFQHCAINSHQRKEMSETIYFSRAYLTHESLLPSPILFNISFDVRELNVLFAAMNSILP